MAGIVDLGIPPVPPLSYWEPETPSPLSPHNPFLSPPAVSPGSPRTDILPLLAASPSTVDRQTAPRSWLFAVALASPCAGTDLSPRFLNPRTPPLPPIMERGLQVQRRHSTMCSIPSSELEKMRHQSLFAVMATVQEKIRKEMNIEREEGLTGREKGWVHRYTTARKRRERRNIVRTKNFRVLKLVDVEV
ncbi:uncharacterized protein CC84DRAFT_1222175 [Paraphaeosphaeria sporulosa]|uniref:Uncharacterized protein n=1 Tax=Paraphaeosphaeria sporulosa TaxID=1460663 RepID=A0A177BYU2_9PLEO|nr:uncharacterized protein CC84DRAFT_1222175 [Paraphaeosphaeria sporulosa]OAG00694.1 hypothetical protein CC84DRAFT_1222175 [Paraphaeosphaeria sporulosa]